MYTDSDVYIIVFSHIEALVYISYNQNTFTHITTNTCIETTRIITQNSEEIKEKNSEYNNELSSEFSPFSTASAISR
jgi:hypothetical protein